MTNKIIKLTLEYHGLVKAIEDSFSLGRHWINK